MVDYFKRLIDNKTQTAPVKQLVEYKLDNWQPEMDTEQLSMVFDRGSSVNIFLRPSDKINNRAGIATYIENYELKNHIREADRYASFTDGHHIGENDSPEGTFSGFRSSYCYSNIGPGFFNFTTLPVQGTVKSNLRIMNKVRYEEMKWIVKDDYALLFDGTTFERNTDIIKAIQDGRNFRITLTLPDNRQFRLDVDLLYYYPDDDTCYGTTKYHFIPTSLTQPQKLHDYCLHNFLDGDQKFHSEMITPFKEDATPTAFYFYSNGQYRAFNEQTLIEKSPYKNIKIFASKL